ncbi:polar amino acid transport system substrate-binding protein [Mesorhizobium sp. J18]|uniref:ABC transporter substrate-binding protein n=1 Tax=Mesorhizobium sp. J18 TaxID=935263 RepID=UPI00119A7ED6|nr:ABC transporter substrate-binding protein [Mesorhizobium sp. J18]TWH01189.1 polar amino acid transport system substrate-binding protein [Mesorhizobium sp. J18]
MKLKSFLAGAALLTIAATQPASAETLNVGSTPTGVPFTFLDVSTNSIQGMMVDLIQAAGKEAGFEVNVQPVDFASLIPSLTSGRIDIISAAMLITDTRKEVINFSDPVMPYGEGIVVAADDNTKISSSFEELAGEVIGVQQGTVYLENLQAAGGFGEVRVYDSLADILSEVNRGRIKAGMGDKPIMAYQLSQGNYPNAKFANYESQYVGSVGLGVRKEDTELLERLNTALSRLKEKGVIDELAAKWGLQ